MADRSLLEYEKQPVAERDTESEIGEGLFNEREIRASSK